MEKKEISLRELYDQIPEDIFEIVSEVLIFLRDFEQGKDTEINDLDKL